MLFRPFWIFASLTVIFGYYFECPELRPLKGFPPLSNYTERPFIIGSKIGWLDVLGYSPEHVESCPVSCLWVLAPDVDQCLEEIDALVFSNSQPPPPSFVKNDSQVWGFFTLESSENYPEILDKEYQLPFDVVSTYRMDSELPVTYFPSDSDILLRPVNFTKTGEVLYLQKNCIPQRDNIVSELMKHIDIDSAGVCLKNTIYPANVSTLEMLSRYRFVIMIENSYAHDWVTERLFNAFIAGTVPVYLGAPNVIDFVPDPAAFIDFRDFPDLQDLALFLKSFSGGARMDEYRDFFEWKNRPLPPNMARLLEASMYVAPPAKKPGEIPPSWRPWAPSLAGDVTAHKDRNEWGEIQGRDFHRDQRLEHCRICSKLKEKRDAFLLNPLPLHVNIQCELKLQGIQDGVGELGVLFTFWDFTTGKDGYIAVRLKSNNRVWHTWNSESVIPPGRRVQLPISYALEWNLPDVYLEVLALNYKRQIIGRCTSTLELIK